MRTVAIIVSAGKGTRFKGKIPKQYVIVNNRPLIYYTLSVFNSSPIIDGIILVTDNIEYFKRYNFKKIFSIVKGGSTRAHSVFNGLKEMPKGVDIVVIHDGVRPFVKQELIKNVVNSAKRYGAAICAVPPKNTIKEIRGSFVKKTLNRRDLIEVQTPQAFRYRLLMNRYNRFDVTDDSTLIELAGHKVKVVRGDSRNIKITTSDDLRYMKDMGDKAQRTGPSAGLRAGIGYDIHRLVKNRRLVLGGVQIPGRYGLLGHSDADVLLHAVTDAMLGAIGEKDIGWHFSNKDAKYKDMASSYFLINAKKILQEKRYRVINIDSIIVAEEPRLQPYYNKMMDNISKWLEIPKKSVTVKFTTPEETGPLGNKEAIASIAIACVKR